MTPALNSQLSAAFRDGVQFAWSATTIKMAETCLRYYQYSMIDGWHSKSQGPHLRFGQHYARAIEHFHKLRAEGMGPNEATIVVVREALEDTWDRTVCGTCHGTGSILEHPKDEPFSQSLAAMDTCHDCKGHGYLDEGHPWNSDHNLKTRETLIRSIVWYLDQFKNDSALPVILSSGAPAVELSFNLPVDNDIMFVGHLDRLADYSDNLYVMDQKTTGSTINQKFFEGFSPDTQMSLYTFAGSAVFGAPVKGVIIDAAQIAVGFTRFERGFTFRTPGQLDEWYDGAMTAILRAQQATRDNHFPQNPSACGNYGGCVFRAVCARDPGVRKNFLAGDFIQGGGYDPLERR